MKKYAKYMMAVGFAGIIGLSACATAAQAGSGTYLLEADSVAADSVIEPWTPIAAPAWEDGVEADFPEFLQFSGQITEIEAFENDVYFVTLFSMEVVNEREIAQENERDIAQENEQEIARENEQEIEEELTVAVVPTTLNLYIDQNTVILAGTGLEMGLEAGSEVGLEVGSEVRLEAGSEVRLEVGMEVTVFYNRPVRTAEPQAGGAIRAIALVDNDTTGDCCVILDRFTKDETFPERDNIIGAFLNSAEDLHVLISEETEIVLQDGTPFDGDLIDLENRKLLFTVDGILWSFPGQALPDKVIILFERAVHPIHNLTEEELLMLEGGMDLMHPDLMHPTDGIIQPDDWEGGLQLTPEDLDKFWGSLFDPETVQIIVDGEVIEAPAPFVNREIGHVMLPVAYISEAVGYTVYGEGEDIVIGRGITFTIGVDSYHYGRMAARPLGAAPEIHEGVVFVPMHFFGEIIPAAAYISDGNIVVSSE